MLIYITDGSLPSNHEASFTEEVSDELTSGAVYAIGVLGWYFETVKVVLVVNFLPLLLYLLHVLLIVVELFKQCTFRKISVSLEHTLLGVINSASRKQRLIMLILPICLTLVLSSHIRLLSH